MEKNDVIFLVIFVVVIVSLFCLLLSHEMNVAKFEGEVDNICLNRGYEFSKSSGLSHGEMRFKCCTITNYDKKCSRILVLQEGDFT